MIFKLTVETWNHVTDNIAQHGLTVIRLWCSVAVTVLLANSYAFTSEKGRWRIYTFKSSWNQYLSGVRSFIDSYWLRLILGMRICNTRMRWGLLASLAAIFSAVSSEYSTTWMTSSMCDTKLESTQVTYRIACEMWFFHMDDHPKLVFLQTIYVTFHDRKCTLMHLPSFCWL